ncbi:hypothetical protein M9H77_05874 [Catharanthus roseus]|uniref:Uncharacterized protein n=1 Tax=Catharanthus roseus TaxID=4058 RepID=A0ACC0BQM5_CATRO|nr:hypothetical protein M9H77_05874 [Catharanthus roseus]
MMSCIVISSAPQANFTHYKHNDVICSKIVVPKFKSLSSRIRALSLVHFSGYQFQLSWKKNKQFSCKWEENFRLLAFSASSEGCNLVKIDSEADGVDADEFLVVNFYRFVFIKEPEEEVSKHLAFMQGRDIHGRIYLNEQGINAQYSGPSKDALEYVRWVREDQRFSDILVQISPALNGHAFPRLKLRYKPSLVQLEGGISHLPLTDSAIRAIPLTPKQWRNRLQALNETVVQSEAGRSANCILLDVRNGYEWDVGHFKGAQRPEVDCFRSTSFGLSESEESESDPLATVDKENTDVLMYCTGGIRCDVYSAILRRRGFRRLYTLEGGISNYLKNEGPEGWVGNLFVFDARLSLPPSTYNPEVKSEMHTKDVPQEASFAKCFICHSGVSELRHRNCANLDCNLLFLSCRSCVNQLRGCCCLKCTSAPRLRPAHPENQRYKKWHHYRDSQLQKS